MPPRGGLILADGSMHCATPLLCAVHCPSALLCPILCTVPLLCSILHYALCLFLCSAVSYTVHCALCLGLGLSCTVHCWDRGNSSCSIIFTGLSPLTAGYFHGCPPISSCGLAVCAPAGSCVRRGGTTVTATPGAHMR